MYATASIVGVVLLLVLISALAFAAMWKKFYKVASPNEAIIRTGKGKTTKGTEEMEELETGAVVAIGRGIWCLPIIHKYLKITFQQWVINTTAQF